MDIVITIPKSEYKYDEKETEYFLSHKDAYQFWNLHRIPKKLNAGDRVYFVKNNKIESSMQVYNFESEAINTCEVTGRTWKGCTLYMRDLKKEIFNFAVKGFQGFRYRWW